MYESDASLPEVEQEQPAENKKENLDISDKEESEAVRPVEPRENGESGLKLLVPPKEIAVRGGRRRPALLVCPTSLISHWVEQLQSHVHKKRGCEVEGTPWQLKGVLRWRPRVPR